MGDLHQATVANYMALLLVPAPGSQFVMVQGGDGKDLAQGSQLVGGDELAEVAPRDVRRPHVSIGDFLETVYI